MLFSSALLASVIVSAVGALILWANPRRPVNLAVALCSQVVAAWLAVSHISVEQKDSLIGLRWGYGSGGLVPASLWLVKESIIRADRIRWSRSAALWTGTAILFFVLPFTNVFIPEDSTSE